MAILTLWFFSPSFCERGGRLKVTTETRSASDLPSERRLVRPAVVSSDPGRVAEVAHGLPDVLHHRHVVLPAVVPELRDGELSLQKDGDACNK